MRAGDARNLATVYRPNEARDSYGDVTANYAAGEDAWIAITRDRSGLVDPGPGDEPSIAAKGLAHYMADIAVRDVLKVTAGPEAGTAWRVIGAFHAGARDTELVLEQFTGSLP